MGVRRLVSKRLVSSRLHELHESKFPFVSRIEFIRSKLSNFSADVYGVSTADTPGYTPGYTQLARSAVIDSALNTRVSAAHRQITVLRRRRLAVSDMFRVTCHAGPSKARHNHINWITTSKHLITPV